MKKYDVVIAGGGPIGGHTAGQIAKNNNSVLLIEEHSEIGIPQKCAGLITPRVFDLIDVSTKNIVQNTILGAHIHSPKGHILTIGEDKTQAIVINRKKFDQAIVKKAQNNGADVKTSHKLVYAKKQNNHLLLTVKHTTIQQHIQTKLLIGADGTHSTIRKQFNFPEPTEILSGIGAEIQNVQLDPHHVHLYLGNNIAPGFFAWVIPTNTQGTQARIGLCTNNLSQHTLKHYSNNLLTTLKKEQPTLTIKKFSSGAIPLGWLPKTTQSNVMLVGDAASQVKPTSGGGIYTGLICAKQCSQTAVQANNSNDFSNKTLLAYHVQCSNKLKREINIGMTFRKIFTHLSDKQIDRYLTQLNTPKNIAIINQSGDIDYPSKLAIPLLRKNPLFIRLLPSALKTKITNR